MCYLAKTNIFCNCIRSRCKERTCVKHFRYVWLREEPRIPSSRAHRSISRCWKRGELARRHHSHSDVTRLHTNQSISHPTGVQSHHDGNSETTTKHFIGLRVHERRQLAAEGLRVPRGSASHYHPHHSCPRHKLSSQLCVHVYCCVASETKPTRPALRSPCVL